MVSELRRFEIDRKAREAEAREEYETGCINSVFDALEALGNPTVFTAEQLIGAAPPDDWRLRSFADPRERRGFKRMLAYAECVVVKNHIAKDGLWKIDGKRRAVYGYFGEGAPDEDGLQAAARALASGNCDRCK